MLVSMTTGTANSTGRRTRLTPEQRRAQLLDCAVSAFADKGIGRAVHADVAERAGVSVATVFNYFSTRDVLVADVLARVGDHFLAIARQVYEDEGYDLAGMAGQAKRFAEVIETQGDYVKVWLEWSASLRDETWPAYLDFYQELTELAERAIRGAKDAGQIRTPMSARDLSKFFIGSAPLLVTMMNTPGNTLDDAIGFVDRTVSAILAPR